MNSAAIRSENVRPAPDPIQYMHKIADKLMQVTARLQQASQQAGRGRDAVRLLAVSKTRPADDIRAAYRCGQRDFGENYLQEALDKQAQLTDLQLSWHFIGPIQSNKTRPIAQAFDWVHSVDRLKIAQRLSDQRPDGLPPLNICLQVNIDDEATKSGVAPAELPALAKAVSQLPRLKLRGLMAIPTPTDDPAQQRQAFRRLAQLMTETNLSQTLQMDTLSMGMSGDLEAAIAEGATWVRVGTDIFGARQ